MKKASNYEKKFGRTIKRTNSYWQSYSHHFARLNYPRKAPKDLEERVLTYLRTMKLGYFAVEWIAKELGVLHKHVHIIVQTLKREGKVRQQRGENFMHTNKRKFIDFAHNNPLTWVNDAWNDNSRHPKLYHLTQKFK